MKTVALFLLMIFVVNVSALDSRWEAKIIEKMLNSMTKKKEIVVYSNDEHLRDVSKAIEKIHMVNNCEKADFILTNTGLNKSCKRPEIVFNYANFLSNTNAVGVFFWQKGRPTIRFSKKYLEYFGLHVSGELSKFVSSKN